MVGGFTTAHGRYVEMTKGLPLHPEPMKMPTRAEFDALLQAVLDGRNNGHPRDPQVLHCTPEFYEKHKDLLGLEKLPLDVEE